MAVVVRCSSFLSRPNRPRSPHSACYNMSGIGIYVRNLDLNTVIGTGKEDSLPFKKQKFGCGQFGVDHSLPSTIFLHCGVNDFRNLQGNCALNQLASLYGKLADQLPVHQGSVSLRYPAMTFLATNAFLLTAPLGALAETCEAGNSSFNMPVLLFVSLVGATVGGLLARQRKGELARLNEQLRQINAALRRQAKIESYAPALSYAPVAGRISESEVIVDPKKHELISRLKAGKNFLRNQDPEKAFMEFKAALEVAQSLADPVEEKKAARGLGASLQRQSKFREAIKYHTMVLAISERAGENSGNTEAYGAIADCYTELGDLEQAGKFYDKYIAGLENE